MTQLSRPTPPAALFEDFRSRFAPADDFCAWIRATFLVDDAPLRNPAHAHLNSASIGVLWTNVPNRRQMRTVIAQAEMPPAAKGAWPKAREEQQLEEWFGEVPDFLITFSVEMSAFDDRTFCAIVEHELYHCAQKLDAFGSPKFRNSDGRPVFALKGHDVEEFVGVVERYGATPQVAKLVQAANAGGNVGLASIAAACGTCLKVAA